MKLLFEENILVSEDRLTHNGDLEIFYPGELDHYKSICRTKEDILQFDFQSDYYGDANEYRSKALREFSRISYYIGKTVSLKDSFGDTQEIIINGLVIDRQYNGNLGIAATYINGDSLDEDLDDDGEQERRDRMLAAIRQKGEEKWAKEIHRGDRVVIKKVLSKKTMNDIMPHEKDAIMALRGKTGVVTRLTWVSGNMFDRTRGGYLYTVKIDDTGEEWDFGKGDLKKIQE